MNGHLYSIAHHWALPFQQAALYLFGRDCSVAVLLEEILVSAAGFCGLQHLVILPEGAALPGGEQLAEFSSTRGIVAVFGEIVDESLAGVCSLGGEARILLL